MKSTYLLITVILFLTSSLSIASIDREEEKIVIPDYEKFNLLSDSEMDDTKGKMGPIVTGLIGGVGGASMSIVSDINADRPVNWTEAGIQGGAGFVIGLSGNVFGGVSGGLAGIALGASTYGALEAAFGTGSISSVGNNCQMACH